MTTGLALVPTENVEEIEMELARAPSMYRDRVFAVPRLTTMTT
jgi:hypothetical protein